jgi:hypothetical protein
VTTICPAGSDAIVTPVIVLDTPAPAVGTVGVAVGREVGVTVEVAVAGAVASGVAVSAGTEVGVPVGTEVKVAVSSDVGVAAGSEVEVAVGSGLGVLVGTAGQPVSAAFTPATISLTAMSPEPSASPATQAEVGALPNAMFTIVMISFTATVPSPSQSPMQAAACPCAARGTLPSASPSAPIVRTRLTHRPHRLLNRLIRISSIRTYCRHYYAATHSVRASARIASPRP